MTSGAGSVPESDLADDSSIVTVDGGVTARSRVSNLVGAARIVLLVGVLAAAGLTLWHYWDAVSTTVATMSWVTVVPAAALVGVGIACGTMSWQVLVDDLGAPIGAGRGAQVFLVGQLGKYLPGSVWAYVLQLELGRRVGLARARVFAATVFSLAVAVVAALVAGTLALPELIEENPGLTWLRWLYLLLPAGLACLHPRILTALATLGFRVLRRPRPTHPVRARTVLHSLGWALGSYSCYGLHLFLLARGNANLHPRDLLLCIGSMGIAMVAGLFAFVLPSGAGVRELVIVTALSPLVGPGRAIAYAAVSRVLFTLADLVMAGSAAGLAVLSRRRRGSYAGDPGI
ncbi:MAG: lysylphosphatidylglycerol synthase domain-containing protein [Cellulomonas sp.]